MGKTTSAERMRKLRKKLKEDEEKHKSHLQSERERDQKRREEMKTKLKLSVRMRNEKRKKEAERKRKYRQKKKIIEITERKVTDVSPLGSYKCVQSLGKAVNKVKKCLPSSPTKKVAVINKLLQDSSDSDKIGLFDKRGGTRVCNALDESTVSKIEQFYERDDISRLTPGIRDVKSVKDLKTGKRKLLQKRHMNMTVREAYQLFITENDDKVKLSKFYELRPKNILLTSEMPHNVCVCKYHANFTFLLEALNKTMPNFPSDSSKFLENICCDVNNETCMTGNCNECTVNLSSLIEERDMLSCSTKWKQWKDIEGHPQLTVTEGSVEAVLNELQSQLKVFKRHVFVKRVQSKVFIEMKRNVEDDEVILQVDFAENYSSLLQDEIQSAHWNNTQITLFTACAWLKGANIRSFVIVTDELSHDKYCVFACIKKIINCLKQEFDILKCVKIFSDGCASQFKNKFTLSNLCFMPADLGVQGEWYFFATSHGKGAVDGIGGLAKRAVWNIVKQRKSSVQCAEEFKAAASSSLPNVKTLLLCKEEIEENREMLNNRWLNVLPIDGTQSKHYFKRYDCENLCVGLTFQSEHKKCKVFKMSVSAVYHTDSEDDDDESGQSSSQDHFITVKPTVAEVVPGTFLLVEFVKTSKKQISKYRYVATAQSGVEEDGEVKVMCMRTVGNTGKLFKADDKDISYLQFEQVLSVLPTPRVKNVRNSIFYEFPFHVDVFEHI